MFESLFKGLSPDWTRFLFFLAGIMFFIFIAEKARTLWGWSPEVNRKLVHVITGVLIFFVPWVFGSSAPLILIAILFAALNLWAVRSGKLKALHSTVRFSYGTVFYPVSFLILVLLCWNGNQAALVLSMLILALADAAAAITGETLKSPREFRIGLDKKSLEGSLAMLAATFLIVLLLLPVVDGLDGFNLNASTVIWIAAVTAIMATVLEAVSSEGSDNLSVPLGSAFIIHYMINATPAENGALTLGMILAGLVGLASYKARFLSASGSVATFILAVLVFGLGGWAWSVPILAFFVLSSLLSKTGKKSKAKFNLMFEKSSQRDMGQVAANGGVAGCLVLVNYFFPNPVWYWAYLGTLAAVTADTWGTELGVFSKMSPLSVKTLRPVEPGTSGGVTLLGLFSGAAGAFLIVISGWVVAPDGFQFSLGSAGVWIVVASGVLASLVDSLIGATVQAQYQCPVCGKITEKRFHCDGQATQQVSGLPWMNNDWVNAFCAMSGALLVWVGFVFVK